MPRLFLLLPLALLAACQSTPGMAPKAMTAMPEARAMTDAERASMLADAEELQKSAPAFTAGSVLAGLDPTGLSQMAVDAEARRRAEIMQRHMPALMADSRARAESFCRENPANSDCLKLREAQAEFENKSRPAATPVRGSSR